jgi:pimeloyl-ACP methyl ester carboxylesterase
MARYVLVHGSWHGGWCWYKLVPRLHKAGHEVDALDLPGHGRDWRAPASVKLGDYVDTVVRALDDASEPAVLVGHSRAGIVISQAAEARPERIRELVYLAAFLLPSGEAMLPTALGDTESLIVANLTVDATEGWHMLAPHAFREALYHDCSDEDVQLASALLTPEPNGPVASPLALTGERFGTVRKTYVETRQDRGVTPGLQRRMHGAVPCDRVLALDTSHSPFLSRPDDLAELLVDL